jgi:glycosyltransferase involved in cell wall biosynthesis
MASVQKKSLSVAVIHPNIMCAGGAEVTGLMTLEYFQDKGYDVDFITDNAVDFNALNEKFSTHIIQAKIRIVRPYLCRLVGKLEPRMHLFAKLQLTLFARYVRKRKDRYDIIVSTKQEADFGKRGIQFLHHLPDGHHTKIYDGPYLWLLRLLGRNDARIASNITISPSYYIKNIFDDTYGSYIKDSVVLYPAIRKCPNIVDWKGRENGFIMTGAVDPLKRTDKAIEIMDYIHGMVPETHLHIIGKGTGKYFEKIKEMAAARDYVHLEGFLPIEKYFEMLTTHKYGIHMRENEPSAVTVRELVDCGLIVFAHHSGGTPEILGFNKHLLFHDLTDAEYKIGRVLSEQNGIVGEILSDLKKIKFNTREDWKKEFEEILGR